MKRDTDDGGRSGTSDLSSGKSPDATQPTNVLPGTISGELLTRRKVLGGTLGLISASGATAGTVFENDVSGRSTTIVDQGVIIRDVEPYVFGNSLGTVSDDGTGFALGADISQGDRYAFQLVVDNVADNQLTQVFRFDEIPDGLSVDVYGDDPTNVRVARDGLNRWLVEIEPEHTGSVPADEQLIEVVVAVHDNAVSGFYTLEGRLAPLDYERAGTFDGGTTA